MNSFWFDPITSSIYVGLSENPPIFFCAQLRDHWVGYILLKSGYVRISGWWFQPTPLWVRQLGWWHSQLNGNIIQMFQTTNQISFLNLSKLSHVMPWPQLIGASAGDDLGLGGHLGLFGHSFPVEKILYSWAVARLRRDPTDSPWLLRHGHPRRLDDLGLPPQGGAPQVISWFIIPLTIDISPINHSYWSYKPT
jgi:hypothetical protein